MRVKDDRKKIITEILKEKDIEGLAERAIDLASTLEWEITEACEQVAGDTIGSISWFLVNYEDYGFLYYIKLSELIEEKAKEILQSEENRLK